jgi:hypothetical protein
MDRIVHDYTGNHLNDIQSRVLIGAITKEHYADIAAEQNCTEGYVRDIASQLWKILSDYIGEPVNKSNVATTLRRKGILSFASDHSQYENHNNSFGYVGSVSGGIRFHLGCNDGKTENDPENDTTSSVLNGFKQNTAEKLRRLGLDETQIAEVLDLPLDDRKP